MSREDIQKLLGGYATGTLTAAERETLFAAALEDQELFDALGREEPLRELLQDPIAKSRLTAALRTTRVPWYQRWLRPALLAASVAAIAVVTVVTLRNPQQQQTVTVARVEPPRPAAPPSAPAVAPAEPRSLKSEREPEPALKKAVPPTAEPAGKIASEAAPAARQSPRDQPPTADALADAPLPPAPAAAPPTPTGPPIPTGITPRAAPRAPVISLQEPVVQAFAARNSFAPAQDARALFFGAPLQLTLQTNLIRAEADAKSRAVAQDANAPAGAAPAPHLGLRYTLRRVPPALSEELNPSQALASVDNLQLSFQPNDGGYLYVFERDAAGQWMLGISEPVARMASYLLPRTGSLAFPATGNMELFVLFSREPINPEDRQLTPRDDMAITTVAADRAVYAVSTRPELPSQRLAFPLTLRRR